MNDQPFTTAEMDEARHYAEKYAWPGDVTDVAKIIRDVRASAGQSGRDAKVMELRREAAGCLRHADELERFKRERAMGS